jgi:hypothetical protein
MERVIKLMNFIAYSPYGIIAHAIKIIPTVTVEGRLSP